MSARPIFRGEARVKGWGHSNASPFRVTLELHRDDIRNDGRHPFEGLEGQTVKVLIGQYDEAQTSKRQWSDLSRAQQAGIRCSEPRFRAWLNDRFGVISAESIDEEAAQLVRQECNVRSRADLDRDLDAGRRWDALDAEFRAWAGLGPELRG